MAELPVKGITELSYRECAAKVSEMTGQTISAMGVWNVIQALGGKFQDGKNFFVMPLSLIPLRSSISGFEREILGNENG